MSYFEGILGSLPALAAILKLNREF